MDGTITELDDPVLIVRAQSGDLAAFEEIVRRYQRPLLRFCRGMLGRGPDAEDAVQDVMVTAWRRLPTLRSAEAASTWLYRIARHSCIDLLRKRQPDGGDPAEYEDRQTPSESSRRPLAGPAEDAETQLALAELWRFVATMPWAQREAWMLREIHGLSYQEIAAITGEKLATVRGRISRARITLAERMDPWK
ncbi:RNA polymerase sigma factor [Arthrobacter rhombi]|uniref:RNA polymerase sigma factor n=1 Tax=Arthrobacter rhombi TaxID=71253 RepID=UPI003FD113BB